MADLFDVDVTNAVVRVEDGELTVKPYENAFENEYYFRIEGETLLLDFMCDDPFYSEIVRIPLTAFAAWFDEQRTKGGI